MILNSVLLKHKRFNSLAVTPRQCVWRGFHPAICMALKVHRLGSDFPWFSIWCKWIIKWCMLEIRRWWLQVHWVQILQQHPEQNDILKTRLHVFACLIAPTNAWKKPFAPFAHQKWKFLGRRLQRWRAGSSLFWSIGRKSTSKARVKWKCKCKNSIKGVQWGAKGGLCKSELDRPFMPHGHGFTTWSVLVLEAGRVLLSLSQNRFHGRQRQEFCNYFEVANWVKLIWEVFLVSCSARIWLCFRRKAHGFHWWRKVSPLA